MDSKQEKELCSKVDLGMGTWRITKTNGVTSTIEIGCSGNMVFTDTKGNRYVPFMQGPAEDKHHADNMMFQENRYVIISLYGNVSYLQYAERV